MGVISNATIVNNGNSAIHSFRFRTGCGMNTISGPVPCLNDSFSGFRSASGIGDLTLRVKGTIWKSERAGFAVGVDVRAPTGDALNFIGAGATGLKPFMVWSYRSRFSPHAVVGYETNGSSLIAGDVTVGSRDRLPSQLTYSGGVDIWATAWFTAAFDVVGQQVFQARRSSLTSFQDLGACMEVYPGCTTIRPPNIDANLAQSTGAFNSTNFSVGAKIRPLGIGKRSADFRGLSNLLVTGNVLLKMNDGGLRAKAIPLIEVSYTF